MKGKSDSYMGDVGIIRKLDDIPELRERLIAAFDAVCADHRAVSRYSVLLARHVLALSGIEQSAETDAAIGVNERWQRGEIRFQAARDTAGVLLDMARGERDQVRAKTLRTLAQVANTPHVKRHALIASDYAVKLVNVMFPGDMEAVRAMREAQIAMMERV